MKMADEEKTEEFVDSESLPEVGSTPAAVRGEQIEALKTETTSSPPGEKELDSPQQAEGEPGLLSMPCLMKELRRDSPESQHASTGSDKPATGQVYESDSSNPCMLSPSSSGHLADSDTLSSGEDATAVTHGAGEGGTREGGVDPGMVTGGQTAAAASGGRKSRRSRSESEMSTPNMMAAKKNRCQPSTATVCGGAGPEKQTNGRLAKVKGHRSQKHKERMRLLRQKREAAARKKYNLLQDSSTSDSDLTCDSSSSSSDDEDNVAAGGKTINTDIPDGPAVVGHYDISDTDSNLESVSVATVRTSVIRQELKTHKDQDMECVRVLNSLSGHMETELSHRESSQHKGQINLDSSDSEVEIVGVQENTRCAHPRGGVIQSLSAWKPNSVEPFNSTRQGHHWTTIPPQPNWVSPPEVVDLTLDEDTRHKYLL